MCAKQAFTTELYSHPLINLSCCPHLFVCLLLLGAAVGRVETRFHAAQAGLELPALLLPFAITPGLLVLLTQMRKQKCLVPDLQGCRVHAVRDDTELQKLRV